MSKRTRRLILVCGVVGVAAVALALTLTALKSTVAYFYTPYDLRELSSPPAGLIRLGGLVAPGS
ncbi:MAG: cytochrome c maturation protein CcmE, partial [Parvularculaceae bacterium]|nr:cytochrome c maturation protein CcmE [Parvularculaceae bacterium]